MYRNADVSFEKTKNSGNLSSSELFPLPHILLPYRHSLQIFRIIINYLLLQNASTKWKKPFFSVMSYQFQRFISGKTIRETFKIQIVWGTSLVFLQFELHELSRALL